MGTTPFCKKIVFEVKMSDELKCYHGNLHCGGCDYIGVPYTEELKKKTEYLNRLFKGLCPVKPILTAEKNLHYRYKVTATFAQGKKDIFLGIYQKGSHKVVPSCDCPLQHRSAEKILRTIEKLANEMHYTVYEEDKQKGLLRHVVLRFTKNDGSAMVTIITGEERFPGSKNFAQSLVAACPEVKTIVQNFNNAHNSAVFGDSERVVFGKGFLVDELLGMKFRVSSHSFYQVYPHAAEILYSTAIDLAGFTGKETFLDAYCGTGTIGLCASKKAKSGMGVEINREAVSDAMMNARKNEVKNMRFVCADATEYLSEMAERGEKLDVLLMDPPRSGSTVEFLKNIALCSPKKIVYISCNPETQVRDILVLKKMGYVPKICVPVDMFPRTEHVETVVLMSRDKE